MSDSRPATPTKVKRELRQESAFGCCRCGFPVIQYHHIVPWHVENHFRPEDMMVLCPTCHDMATKNFMSVQEQRRHKDSPYNVQRGYVGGTLGLNQDYAAIDVGGMLLVGDGAYMAVDKEEVLRLDVDEFGQLLLTVQLESENGEALAVIDKNEWVSGDSGLWDMTADHGKLKIWSASRQVSLELNATRQPVSVRADLWKFGQCLRLSRHGMTFGNHPAAGGIRNLGLVGFGVNLTPSKTGELYAYRGAGIIVAQPPELRLNQAIDAWNHLAQPAFFPYPGGT